MLAIQMHLSFSSGWLKQRPADERDVNVPVAEKNEKFSDGERVLMDYMIQTPTQQRFFRMGGLQKRQKSKKGRKNWKINWKSFTILWKRNVTKLESLRDAPGFPYSDSVFHIRIQSQLQQRFKDCEKKNSENQ